MEKMPYRQELDVHFPQRTIDPVISTITTDWRQSLPVLASSQVTLRQLRASDAQSLCALLTTEEVSRFISPPPSTVEGFERFIAWTLRQRAAGSYVCFAVTLRGFDSDTMLASYLIDATRSEHKVHLYALASFLEMRGMLKGQPFTQ